MKTKTLLFIVIAFLFTSLQTMAQNDDKHILVAYFSATGTTARAAEKLADITAGDFTRLRLSNLTRVPTSTGTTSSHAARRR